MKAPRKPGRSLRSYDRSVAGDCLTQPCYAALLRSFGLDHLGLTVADRDLARPLGLRNLAHEIDVQETVLEPGALDVDVVGKLEDALEGASRDALVEHL